MIKNETLLACPSEHSTMSEYNSDTISNNRLSEEQQDEIFFDTFSQYVVRTNSFNESLQGNHNKDLVPYCQEDPDQSPDSSEQEQGFSLRNSFVQIREKRETTSSPVQVQITLTKSQLDRLILMRWLTWIVVFVTMSAISGFVHAFNTRNKREY